MQIPNLPNIDPKLFRVALVISIISLVVGSWLWYQGRPSEIIAVPVNEVITEPMVNKIFVHVAGEVRSAGVYELDSGARVIDAITAAGGVTKKANLTMLNLARVLFDGEQILVGDSASNPTSASGGKVSINQADTSQLDSLPGIGPAIAARIISHREQNGPFRSLVALKDVSGIGDAVFAKIEDLITL